MKPNTMFKDWSSFHTLSYFLIVVFPVENELCKANCSEAYDKCRPHCKGDTLGLAMERLCQTMYHKCVERCDVEFPSRR